LLRDSENPAHDKWRKSADKLKRNYKNAGEVIDFIKISFQAIIKRLSGTENTKDFNTLASLFPDLNDEGAPKNQKRSSKSPKKSQNLPLPFKPLKTKKRRYTLHCIEGGFTISGTEHLSPKNLGSIINIKMAYDIDIGNPFKKWVIDDFDVKKMILIYDESSLNITKQEGNILVVEILQLPLKLQVKGFDTNRDVIVDVKFKVKKG
jgi:hypothetical protein